MSSKLLNCPYRDGAGSDGISKITELGKVAVPGPLGVVGADADALPAVDAALAGDDRLAAPHPDGLGGAALDAVGAAHALFLVQCDGMVKFSHVRVPP